MAEMTGAAEAGPGWAAGPAVGAAAVTNMPLAAEDEGHHTAQLAAASSGAATLAPLRHPKECLSDRSKTHCTTLFASEPSTLSSLITASGLNKCNVEPGKFGLVAIMCLLKLCNT